MAPHGSENSQRKSPQCQTRAMPGQPPPRCSLLAESQAPGPVEVWLSGNRSKKGKGQGSTSPLGHESGLGLAAMPVRAPASAVLPPCCHSNALRPPPQHPAASHRPGERGAVQPAARPSHRPILQQIISGCPPYHHTHTHARH